MSEKLEVYDYKDIMAILGIGKNKAYSVLNSGQFAVIRIGNHTKVSKQIFESWLHSPQKKEIS